MKNISGKKLCKILEKNSWNLAGISGSHHVYTKEGEEVKIVVPVHGNKELRMAV